MNANLRTTFAKLIRRAGLERWPRPFHDLRAGRETEPADEFPIRVVAAWMGHDPKVSLKHYAQTTDEHFARAAGGAESGAQSSGAAGRGEPRRADGVGGSVDSVRG